MKRFIYFLITAFIFTASSLTASAASYSVNGPTVIAPGSQVQWTIMLNTENDEVNAFSGAVVLPASISISELNDGGATAVFWVEKPTVKQGELLFSGIIPSGRTGQFPLFSVTVKTADQSSSGALSFDQAQFLKNDGKGTALPNHSADFHFSIDSVAKAAAVDNYSDDHESPEHFTPLLGNDPALFGGEWFVAFNTVDKRSGVAYYQVIESPSDYSPQDLQNPEIAWQTVQSPYKLTDQKLQSYVYVRAFDHNGNWTVEKLSPEHPLSSPLLLFVALGLLFILCFGFWKWTRKRYN